MGPTCILKAGAAPQTHSVPSPRRPRCGPRSEAAFRRVVSRSHARSPRSGARQPLTDHADRIADDDPDRPGWVAEARRVNVSIAPWFAAEIREPRPSPRAGPPPTPDLNSGG